MKVLQIIQRPQLRGAEVFACQLSSHLINAGHEVMIIALQPGTANLPWKGPLVLLDRPPQKRFIDWEGWKRLAEIIREFRPDIVQANAGDTLKFAVLSRICFRWTTPLIFRNANKVSDFIRSWPQWAYNKFLTHFLRHVISVSERCRIDFIKTYRFNSSKTTCVPIGIETHLNGGSLPPDLEAFFARGKVLVHAASFVREKNHHGMLRILAKLKESGEHVNVLFLGDGKVRSEAENWAKELNVSQRVCFAGYREMPLPIIARASALVLPSLIEGLPAVILEAMFCRVPVIANDVGGISEVIETGVTGWLVNAGDESAFANTIRKVIHEDQSKVVAAARDRVVAEFDNQKIADRFLKVYSEVLGIKVGQDD